MSLTVFMKALSAAAFAGPAAAGLSGSADPAITMWSSNPNEIVSSACGYAALQYGGVSSPAALAAPYEGGGTMLYAAVDCALWNNGEACGKYDRTSYDGSAGTDAGRAGEATVQVMDTGSAKPFDLMIDAFGRVTGATTGVFSAAWQQVACQTSARGAEVAVLDAQVDAVGLWWLRVVLHDPPAP